MESLQLKFTAECRFFMVRTCVVVSTVHRWAKKCIAGKPGTADLCVKQWSGQSMMAANEFHKIKIDELIKDNQRPTQRETAVKLGISQECVGHIIDVLQYRKVCARWVPQISSHHDSQ
jgi:hypothetical protein